MIKVEQRRVFEIDDILKSQPYLINQKNSSGYTALGVAIRLGEQQIVKKLISHGADINTMNNVRKCQVISNMCFYSKIYFY